MTLSSFRSLAECAADRYRAGGRFAHGFARGKLTGDPAFEFLLTQGLLNPSPQIDKKSLSRHAAILDLGCGQGVLAALLEEARQADALGQWPQDWPTTLHSRVHGIELMQSDVQRAQSALGNAADFVTGDIAETAFPPAHTVVILDVLHYLPFDAQDRVLAAVLAALPPGGRLLLRVGDADAGFGFRWSNWVDHVVTWCRGHRLPRLYCRPVSAWTRLLSEHGFSSTQKPMSAGTLFSNVLFVAIRAPSGTDHLA